MLLDHGSTIPLYIQLKEHLRTQIETGVYPSGARLPSERDLAQAFQVSRMTARQALQLLAKDGFISSRVGKGTYVRRPKIAQDLYLLTSFTEDICQRGMVPGSRIIRAALDRADDEIAGHLQVAAGTEIILLSRVRLADNEPIAWEICHLNHRLCPGILERHDFSRESLYQVLREEYGCHLIWADQLISARIPDRRQRVALQLDDKTPVLSLTRVTYADHDQPVEFVRSVYRCDRYHLRTILRYTCD
ncbi:MAG: GntR family transcriptional regulator [Planctomycetaceae bacterium]|nr:MAG: GntR family transcriptional regulator [Planctomycetaceae bacterium]